MKSLYVGGSVVGVVLDDHVGIVESVIGMLGDHLGAVAWLGDIVVVGGGNPRSGDDLALRGINVAESGDPIGFTVAASDPGPGVTLLGSLTNDELYRVANGGSVDVTDRFKAAFESGGSGAKVAPVPEPEIDYKAEVRSYLGGVDEGGVLMPGFYKFTDESGIVYPAMESGDEIYFPLDSPDPDCMNDEDYHAAWYFLRLDLRRGGESGVSSSPAKDETLSEPEMFDFIADDGEEVKAATFQDAVKALVFSYGISGVRLVSDTHELRWVDPDSGNGIVCSRVPTWFYPEHGVAGLMQIKIVPKPHKVEPVPVPDAEPGPEDERMGLESAADLIRSQYRFILWGDVAYSTGWKEAVKVFHRRSPESSLESIIHDTRLDHPGFTLKWVFHPSDRGNIVSHSDRMPIPDYSSRDEDLRMFIKTGFTVDVVEIKP